MLEPRVGQLRARQGWTARAGNPAGSVQQQHQGGPDFGTGGGGGGTEMPKPGCKGIGGFQGWRAHQCCNDGTGQARLGWMAPAELQLLGWTAPGGATPGLTEPTNSGSWCSDDGTFCLLCQAYMTDGHLMSEKHTRNMKWHRRGLSMNMQYKLQLLIRGLESPIYSLKRIIWNFHSGRQCSGHEQGSIWRTRGLHFLTYDGTSRNHAEEEEEMHQDPVRVSLQDRWAVVH